MRDSRNYLYSREYVVGRLRRQGFPELAEVASRELPDPVDVDQFLAWGIRYGLTTDELISQMGGSP